MCEFCDTETKIAAQKEAKYFAAVLVNLAQEYRSLATGALNPHSDDTKIIKELSVQVIKELVEWI